MASVPLSNPGSNIVTDHMREARQKGMSRNMATAGTYYWFYQKTRLSLLSTDKSAVCLWILEATYEEWKAGNGKLIK